MILIFLNVVLIVLFSFRLQSQFEQSSIDLRKKELKRLVTVGLHSIENYRNDYAAGLLTKEKTLELITNHVRSLTYDDELQPNYLFMSSYDGIMLVQPFEPEKEGSNQWNLKDSDGGFIIRKLIDQAKREPGYVFYNYFPPGSEVPQMKISYVEGLQELECYIGTGMYISDIKTLVNVHFRQTLLLYLLVSGILIISAIVYILPLINSVQYIARKFVNLGEGILTEAPEISPERFRKGSDSYRLVEEFSKITEQLVNSNNKLLKTTEERGFLVKEMNHRVKNNLQIIISLLRIQQEQNEDETIKKAFLESITRLESISIIHKMLYSGGDISTISGERYLKELVGFMIHSYGAEDRVAVEYDTDSTLLSMEKAVPLGIITNEAVTNSIKYAFPSGGKGSINIRLKSENNKKHYTISDNGPGIDLTRLKEKSSSLGINLIRNLAKQLNGELTMNTDGGTSYTIVW